MLGEKRFGSGMIWPFQRDGQGDLLQASGLDLVDADVRLLIGTIKGELKWDTNRGTKLIELLHRSIVGSTADAIATSFVAEVINNYEPRVRAGETRAEQNGSSLNIFTEYVPLGYNKGKNEVITAKTRIG
jgi:phage baseplate assembly protein W